MEETMYLWNRIGRHQPENVRLDSLIHPQHRLELTRVHGLTRRLLQLSRGSEVIAPRGKLECRFALGGSGFRKILGDVRY